MILSFITPSISSSNSSINDGIIKPPIGDDLNDLKMLKKAGLSFAPQNANELVKNSVNIVCKKSGGSGAAREMIEYILKEENLEEEFLNLWL